MSARSAAFARPDTDAKAAIRRAEAKAKRERLEKALIGQMRGANLPEPRRQHRFCDRRWAFDFCWPHLRLALEVDGGTWSGGRHTTGAGFRHDVDKLNEAALLGWMVIRVTSDMVRDTSAVTLLARAVRIQNERLGWEAEA